MIGRDARLARGQGLFRRRQAQRAISTSIGVPTSMKPGFAVMRGRLAEALGHDKDALDEYRPRRPRRTGRRRPRQASSTSRCGRSATRSARTMRCAISKRLSMTWRGDGIEVQTLQMLARHLLRDRPLWRGARGGADRHQAAAEFGISRQVSGRRVGAVRAALPRAEGRRSSAGRCARDVLRISRSDADRPARRRNDPPARRSAGRVDLLDQASELLQYQIDHRLEGAARAQVAARLAMVYLTNRKPDRAIAALRTTRIADLAGELRQQRLLLEARAQSDIGRHDLALDIISNITGPRGDPAALRYLLGGAALARGIRADRALLRRSLARFQTAEPGGEERHHPRRDRLCAGRGCASGWRASAKNMRR